MKTKLSNLCIGTCLIEPNVATPFGSNQTIKLVSVASPLSTQH